jgi:hypothetical protein
MHRASDALRAVAPGIRDAWREDVTRPMNGPARPDATQEAALGVLAEGSISSLRVDWDGERRSPARLEAVGFVRRGVDARGVWDAFLRAHEGSLQALLGETLGSELNLLATDRAEGFDILRFERRRGGLPVLHESLDVWVTAPSSALGEGVLWRIETRWRPRLPEMPSTPRSGWMNAEEVRREALDDASAQAARLVLSCGRTCTPLWLVQTEVDQLTWIDAVRRTRLSSFNPATDNGPATIAGFPPGATASQPVALRNAGIYSLGDNTLVDTTSQIDGSHSLWTGTYSIGLYGPDAPAGQWPNGRIRVVVMPPDSQPGATGVLQRYSALLYPSVGTSDLSATWSSNASPYTNQFPKSAQTTYGWLSYWLAMASNQLFVEVPGTVDIELYPVTPAPPAPRPTSYINAGQTTPISPLPGTGQTSRFAYRVGVRGDSIGPPGSGTFQIGDSTWSAAHEFSHTVIGCAAQSGPGCFDGDPFRLLANDSQRMQPTMWRGMIHSSAVEDLANMIAHVLTQFRYDIARDGSGYSGTWTYDTYDSGNDDFGTPTQDAAGGGLCTVAGWGGCIPQTNPCCPGGFWCQNPSWGSTFAPEFQGGSLCGRLCGVLAPGVTCQRGLTCQDDVCVPQSPYANRLFATTGVRMAMTANWSETLRGFLLAADGNSYNALRDFSRGSDNWHDRVANAVPHLRYEVSRAFRSVSVDPQFAVRDDFPDVIAHAVPIPVHAYSPVPIWWGHGAAAYPRLEDPNDLDVFLFRGVGGSHYRIATAPAMGSAAMPWVGVYRWSQSYDYVAGAWGQSTIDDTGALPADDWYAVVVFNASLSGGEWQGSIRVLDGYDDYSSALSEAYPLLSGQPVVARSTYGTDGDVGDAFKIHAPFQGDSLTVTANGAGASVIYLYQPNGVFYTSGVNAVSVPSIPVEGDWTWIVSRYTDGQYSTSASLSCASSVPACDASFALARPSTHTWGDQFAGRLLAPGDYQEFEVSLYNNYEHVSFSASDQANGCALELRVYAPPSMAYFDPDPIMRWRDGAAVNAAAPGTDSGVGGHLAAMLGGTYRVRVANVGTAACDAYRLTVARSNFRSNAMLAW